MSVLATGLDINTSAISGANFIMLKMDSANYPYSCGRLTKLHRIFTVNSLYFLQL